MILDIEIPPTATTILIGLLGRIKYIRGKNTYIIKYYNNQNPTYWINDEKIPNMQLDPIPDTILIAIRNQATKLGWIS